MDQYIFVELSRLNPTPFQSQKVKPITFIGWIMENICFSCIAYNDHLSHSISIFLDRQLWFQHTDLVPNLLCVEQIPGRCPHLWLQGTILKVMHFIRGSKCNFDPMQV